MDDKLPEDAEENVRIDEPMMSEAMMTLIASRDDERSSELAKRSRPSA